VVLYCSVDDVYAKPIIGALRSRTGLRIDALFDTEAAKTAGLANRIRAERHRPRGDVFWNSALLQTLLLQRDGLLQPYAAPAARGIPAAFKDRQGHWTAMGMRPRVLVFHESLRQKPVRRIQDLLHPRLRGRMGISNPQFGTASDWAAALAARNGVHPTLQFFRRLKANQVRVLPGNSVVAERVARGDLLAGITDSDDYLAVRRKSKSLLAAPVTPGAMTVLVPGSVAMLRGAPHPAAARRLIAALLSPDVERLLLREMPGVFPVHRSNTEQHWPPHTDTLQVARHTPPGDTSGWPAAWSAVRDPLAAILMG